MCENPKSFFRNPVFFSIYFTLWFTVFVVLFGAISLLWEQHDPFSLPFFLSLPVQFREHYSRGTHIKVQTSRTVSPIDVFAYQSENNPNATENVVIVHGLGLNSFGFRDVVDTLGAKGFHAVSFDLPGHGFSNKTMEVLEEGSERGVPGRMLDVYYFIREKGLFWAFDRIVETGMLPYDEILENFSRKRAVTKPASLRNDEVGMVLMQIINAMELAPVHLVLHDASLSIVGPWISQNPRLVRSVSLLDVGLKPAVPLWLMDVPAASILSMASTVVYKGLISFCCSRGIPYSELLGHRKLYRTGMVAMREMSSKLNESFDVVEWSNSEVIKGIPVEVIWSKNWSTRWSKQGDKVSKAFSSAIPVTHSGGRWPNKDSSREIADHITEFIGSLPKSSRPNSENIRPVISKAQARETVNAYPDLTDVEGSGQEWET